MALMTADEARECISALKGHIDQAGELLLDLYEREGWRSLGYDSWRQCVMAEFDYSIAHLYRLMNGARDLRELSPMGDTDPLPERRLREVRTIQDEDKRRELMEQARELPFKELAALARDVRSELTERQAAEPKALPQRAPAVMTLARPARARLIVADVRKGLGMLEPESVQTVVTSPPYWRQRDYHLHGQIGQEATPEAWVSELVSVMRLARPVLAHTGVVWLNLGDKYAAGGMGGGGMAERRKNWRGTMGKTGWRAAPYGYKRKDITLLPFKLAEALRADGWYLRATVIWEKASAVEPPRLDRPSASHEYVFLLSCGVDSSARNPGEPWWYTSTWRIPPHPALMPQELARRCVVASSSPGDTVLDLFAGIGTTLMVAARHGRDSVGIELNPSYAHMARDRIQSDSGFTVDVSLEEVA